MNCAPPYSLRSLVPFASARAAHAIARDCEPFESCVRIAAPLSTRARRYLNNNSFTSFDPAICPFAPPSAVQYSDGSTYVRFNCSLNSFTCLPACLAGQCGVAAVCAGTTPPPPPPPSPPPPPGYCSASGAAGSDDFGECAALLDMYTAWGSQPAAWAAGIASGASYCSWDPFVTAYQTYSSGGGYYYTAGSLNCTNGRVTTLCAPLRWCNPLAALKV